MAKLFLNESLLKVALKHINEEIQVDPETGEWFDDGNEDDVTPHDDWEDAIYRQEMRKNRGYAQDDEPVYEDNNSGLDNGKTYWVSAGSSYPIDLKLKGEDINYCSQAMGSDNYQNAMELISSSPEIAEQLNGISDEQLDKWWFEDSFFDMNDEEKASATREEKLAYLLADACSNAAEGYAEETDVSECGTQPLFESYGVGYNGRFISNRKGWGPTFTSFPEDAKSFESPDMAQQYIDEFLPDFGASVVSLPHKDEELYELKKTIKSLIRESLYNMFGPDMMEKHTLKSKHSQNNKHKTKSKNAGQARHTKRAIVIQWLKDPANAVNCAEIMRQLWHPAPEEEDTKRGEFYKKRDGAINQDSGARYSFSDEEINALYRIKSHTG